MSNEYPDSKPNFGCSSDDKGTSSSSFSRDENTNKFTRHVINLRESKTHLFYLIQPDNENSENTQNLIRIKISKERPTSRNLATKKMLLRYDSNDDVDLSDKSQTKIRKTPRPNLASIHKRTDHPSFYVLPEVFSKKRSIGSIRKKIDRNQSTSDNSNETYIVRSKGENNLYESFVGKPIGDPKSEDYCECGKNTVIKSKDQSNRDSSLPKLQHSKLQPIVSANNKSPNYPINRISDELFKIKFVEPTQVDNSQRLRAGQDRESPYKSCYVCPNMKRIFPQTGSRRQSAPKSNYPDSNSSMKNSNGYVKINYKLVRHCLIYGSINEKCEVLDPIRLRMKSSDLNVATNTVEDIVRFDLFGVQCECRSKPLLEELFWPINVPTPYPLQTSIARFVNALVSFKIGRSYFTNRSIIHLLTFGDIGRDNIDETMGDNLIGIMMKLSCNRSQWSDMIKNGLFRWLLTHMEEVEYSASKYHVTMMTGLLRNLLKGENINDLSPKEIQKLIVLLGRYFNTENSSAKSYICDSLLTLFQKSEIVASAKELNFSKIIEEHLMKAGSSKEKEHLRAVHHLLNGSTTSFNNRKFESRSVEPFLDSDLEPNAPTEIDYYPGECLLKDKFSGNEEVPCDKNNFNKFNKTNSEDTRKDGKLKSRVFVEHLNCFLPKIEKNRIFPLCNARCADKIKTCSHIGDVQPKKRQPYIPPNSRTSGLPRHISKQDIKWMVPIDTPWSQQSVDESIDETINTISDEDNKSVILQSKSDNRLENSEKSTHLISRISTISHDKSAARWNNFEKRVDTASVKSLCIDANMARRSFLKRSKTTGDVDEGKDIFSGSGTAEKEFVRNEFSADAQHEEILRCVSYHNPLSKSAEILNGGKASQTDVTIIAKNDKSEDGLRKLNKEHDLRHSKTIDVIEKGQDNASSVSRKDRENVSQDVTSTKVLEIGQDSLLNKEVTGKKSLNRGGSSDFKSTKALVSGQESLPNTDRRSPRTGLNRENDSLTTKSVDALERGQKPTKKEVTGSKSDRQSAGTRSNREHDSPDFKSAKALVRDQEAVPNTSSNSDRLNREHDLLTLKAVDTREKAQGSLPNKQVTDSKTDRQSSGIRVNREHDSLTSKSVDAQKRVQESSLNKITGSKSERRMNRLDDPQNIKTKDALKLSQELPLKKDFFGNKSDRRLSPSRTKEITGEMTGSKSEVHQVTTKPEVSSATERGHQSSSSPPTIQSKQNNDEQGSTIGGEKTNTQLLNVRSVEVLSSKRNLKLTPETNMGHQLHARSMETFERSKKIQDLPTRALTKSKTETEGALPINKELTAENRTLRNEISGKAIEVIQQLETDQAKSDHHLQDTSRTASDSVLPTKENQLKEKNRGLEQELRARSEEILGDQKKSRKLSQSAINEPNKTVSETNDKHKLLNVKSEQVQSSNSEVTEAHQLHARSVETLKQPKHVQQLSASQSCGIKRTSQPGEEFCGIRSKDEAVAKQSNFSEHEFGRENATSIDLLADLSTNQDLSNEPKEKLCIVKGNNRLNARSEEVLSSKRNLNLSRGHTAKDNQISKGTTPHQLHVRSAEILRPTNEIGESSATELTESNRKNTSKTNDDVIGGNSSGSPIEKYGARTRHSETSISTSKNMLGRVNEKTFDQTVDTSKGKSVAEKRSQKSKDGEQQMLTDAVTEREAGKGTDELLDVKRQMFTDEVSKMDAESEKRTLDVERQILTDTVTSGQSNDCNQQRETAKLTTAVTTRSEMRDRSPNQTNQQNLSTLPSQAAAALKDDGEKYISGNEGPINEMLYKSKEQNSGANTLPLKITLIAKDETDQGVSRTYPVKSKNQSRHTKSLEKVTADVSVLLSQPMNTSKEKIVYEQKPYTKAACSNIEPTKSLTEEQINSQLLKPTPEEILESSAGAAVRHNPISEMTHLLFARSTEIIVRHEEESGQNSESHSNVDHPVPSTAAGEKVKQSPRDKNLFAGLTSGLTSGCSSDSSISKSKDCVNCGTGTVLRARSSQPCENCKASLTKYRKFVEVLNNEGSPSEDDQQRVVTRTSDESIRVSWINKSKETPITSKNQDQTKEDEGDDETKRSADMRRDTDAGNATKSKGNTSNEEIKKSSPGNKRGNTTTEATEQAVDDQQKSTKDVQETTTTTDQTSPISTLKMQSVDFLENGSNVKEIAVNSDEIKNDSPKLSDHVTSGVRNEVSASSKITATRTEKNRDNLITTKKTDIDELPSDKLVTVEIPKDKAVKSSQTQSSNLSKKIRRSKSEKPLSFSSVMNATKSLIEPLRGLSLDVTLNTSGINKRLSFGTAREPRDNASPKFVENIIGETVTISDGSECLQTTTIRKSTTVGPNILSPRSIEIITNKVLASPGNVLPSIKKEEHDEYSSRDMAEELVERNTEQCPLISLKKSNEQTLAAATSNDLVNQMETFSMEHPDVTKNKACDVSSVDKLIEREVSAVELTDKSKGTSKSITEPVLSQLGELPSDKLVTVEISKDTAFKSSQNHSPNLSKEICRSNCDIPSSLASKKNANKSLVKSSRGLPLDVTLNTSGINKSVSFGAAKDNVSPKLVKNTIGETVGKSNGGVEERSEADSKISPTLSVKNELLEPVKKPEDQVETDETLSATDHQHLKASMDGLPEDASARGNDILDIFKGTLPNQSITESEKGQSLPVKISRIKSNEHLSESVSKPSENIAETTQKESTPIYPTPNPLSSLKSSEEQALIEHSVSRAKSSQIISTELTENVKDETPRDDQHLPQQKLEDNQHSSQTELVKDAKRKQSTPQKSTGVMTDTVISNQFLTEFPASRSNPQEVVMFARSIEVVTDKQFNRPMTKREWNGGAKDFVNVAPSKEVSKQARKNITVISKINSLEQTMSGVKNDHSDATKISEGKAEAKNSSLVEKLEEERIRNLKSENIMPGLKQTLIKEAVVEHSRQSNDSSVQQSEAYDHPSNDLATNSTDRGSGGINCGPTDEMKSDHPVKSKNNPADLDVRDIPCGQGLSPTFTGILQNEPRSSNKFDTKSNVPKSEVEKLGLVRKGLNAVHGLKETMEEAIVNQLSATQSLEAHTLTPTVPDNNQHSLLDPAKEGTHREVGGVKDQVSASRSMVIVDDKRSDRHKSGHHLSSFKNQQSMGEAAYEPKEPNTKSQIKECVQMSSDHGLFHKVRTCDEVPVSLDETIAKKLEDQVACGAACANVLSPRSIEIMPVSSPLRKRKQDEVDCLKTKEILPAQVVNVVKRETIAVRESGKYLPERCLRKETKSIVRQMDGSKISVVSTTVSYDEVVLEERILSSQRQTKQYDRAGTSMNQQLMDDNTNFSNVQRGTKEKNKLRVNSSCWRKLLDNEELINKLSEKVLQKLLTEIHMCGPNCKSPCGGLNPYYNGKEDNNRNSE